VNLICFDLEGVFVPEIWIAVAKATGIRELELTTRDVPDYDLLMRKRLAILDEAGLGLPDIRKVISGIEPLDGARSFLDSIRSRYQVIILSDTYEQFAGPLLEKLGRPTLFCNTLVVDESGRIADYRLRIRDGKRVTVTALAAAGLRIAAVGDSYNDLGMIDAADYGALFNPPATIVTERPDLTVTTTYDELDVALEKWASGGA
jgi:phosphoserine / homoserine phosphotransferase